MLPPPAAAAAAAASQARRGLASASASLSRGAVLSGIQPTGVMTLGNIMGAVRQWKRLQDSSDDDCFFMVVDLHALTMPYNPALLQNMCRVQAASMVACGIDPERSVVFRQSAVPAHAELQWILGCITPLGWLQRMTQFKDKSELIKASAKAAMPSRGQEQAPLLRRTAKAGLGLLAYPVLQAADILLYRAERVPVGDDQQQHLELTRDVAATFNALFAAATDDAFALPIPEAIVPDRGAARVMSLRNGREKMSKSSTSRLSRIDITDGPDTIRNKIRRAKTDALPGLEYDWEQRPERANLLAIFSELSQRPVQDLVEEFETKDTVTFKDALADVIVDHFAGPQQVLRRLLGVDDLEALGDAVLAKDADAVGAMLSDTGELDAMLQSGEERAHRAAEDTMGEVRRLTGLVQRR